eukprot:Skav212429  [mRNA]  locus=scaffold1479:49121:50395:+ [translate_table: standard]
MPGISAGNSNRSRSLSDNYIVPRLSLQNKDDVELSPRVPLSPRGNPPAAPYMSSTPRSASADNLHKSLERISPRFGQRDENLVENLGNGKNQSPQVSGKRNGGHVSGSASKIRTALREHSASSARSTARERRPNPLLGNSPPARPTLVSSPGKVNGRISDSGSSGSSDHSGPSLGSKTVVPSSLTPSTSTTSLVMHAGQRISAGVEMRRSEAQPRTSVPSEDFQGLSQGGPLPPVEGEEPSALDVSWGSEQVEFLCQKAQSLVRQMGSRPPSAHSSPCIKVSPPMASPCTPCNRSEHMKFSPGLRPVLPDITNLQDFTELKHRLSQVEQQVVKLRGRVQTVESESVDLGAALKEVRVAVFAEKPGERQIAQGQTVSAVPDPVLQKAPVPPVPPVPPVAPASVAGGPAPPARFSRPGQHRASCSA